MIEVLIVLAIAAIATVGGIWFGIVALAPRLARLLDRAAANEEEPGDQSD